MNEKIYCSKPEGQKRWRLPPGMADMTEAPLYLAVAVWGLRLERVITIDDISRNFCITQRQASDVLHYITHEGTTRVKFERRVIIRDVRGRRTGLRIRAVTMPEPDEIRPRRKKKVVPPPPSGAGFRGNPAQGYPAGADKGTENMDGTAPNR